MKAWILDDFSGVDSMEIKDVETPEPGEGRVLVKLHFAGLNPADNYLAQKMYPARPKFPHVLGRDGVGEVVKCGPKVGLIQEGHRVALLRGEAGVSEWGTFAEYVSVPESMVVRVPDGWSEKEAGAAPLVYLTAHQALHQWGVMPPGVSVLITGISGGVGVAALQLAKALELKVIGTSRSPEKAKSLMEMGADLVIDPYDSDFVKKIREFTGKPGVALAIDNIGGKAFDGLLDVMGTWGKISVVGRLAGPVPEFNTAKLFFRRLRIGGVAVGTYTAEESSTYWQEVVESLNKIEQRPLIDSIHEFKDLKDAFNRLGEGPLGKVMIQTSV